MDGHCHGEEESARITAHLHSPGPWMCRKTHCNVGRIAAGALLWVTHVDSAISCTKGWCAAPRVGHLSSLEESVLVALPEIAGGWREGQQEGAAAGGVKGLQGAPWGAPTLVRPKEEGEAAGCWHTRTLLDHEILLQCRGGVAEGLTAGSGDAPVLGLGRLPPTGCLQALRSPGGALGWGKCSLAPW